jgi:hypothetical protein
MHFSIFVLVVLVPPTFPFYITSCNGRTPTSRVVAIGRIELGRMNVTRSVRSPTQGRSDGRFIAFIPIYSRCGGPRLRVLLGEPYTSNV